MADGGGIGWWMVDDALNARSFGKQKKKKKKSRLDNYLVGFSSLGIHSLDFLFFFCVLSDAGPLGFTRSNVK